MHGFSAVSFTWQQRTLAWSRRARHGRFSIVTGIHHPMSVPGAHAGGAHVLLQEAALAKSFARFQVANNKEGAAMANSAQQFQHPHHQQQHHHHYHQQQQLGCSPQQHKLTQQLCALLDTDFASASSSSSSSFSMR